MSDALLGLTSKDLERGLAGGQQIVSNQPYERRRILLEARDRQHELAGASEAPLLPKSRHRDFEFGESFVVGDRIQDSQRVRPEEELRQRVIRSDLLRQCPNLDGWLPAYQAGQSLEE